jgi:hypothetical protein
MPVAMCLFFPHSLGQMLIRCFVFRFFLGVCAVLVLVGASFYRSWSSGAGPVLLCWKGLASG